MASRCPHCGNNPVPHALAWYFESINTLLEPLRTALLYNRLSSFMHRAVVHGNWPVKLTRFFLKLCILSFQNYREECRVERARVLWEEAEERGIEFKEILLLGRPWDTYWAEKDGRVVVFSGLPRPQNADPKTLEILDDKLKLKKVLSRAGLPVPVGESVWSWRGAKKVFSRLTKPVIVKPRSGSRGRHTTTFIYTEKQLEAAFRSAKQLCFWVMVEEHLPGPVYRGTVINYQTRGVLRGDPPQVLGDGRSSIAELVQKFNFQPPAGVREIKISPLTENFLARQNLFLSYIPARGEKIQLSEKIGVSYGGNAVEEIHLAHPDNIHLFEQAARVLQDPLIGFDFIIPDIARSFKQQRSGFIEANSLPFINLHHNPAAGPPQNIARWVWEMIGF